MFAKVLLKTGVLCVAVGLAACSDDDNKGDGGDRYGSRQIDTSNFTNSASESEFKQKGAEVDGYFDDMKEVKKPFLASGAGNNLLGRMFGLAETTPASQSASAIDPNAGDCTSETSTDVENGIFLLVETKTCVQTIQGDQVTCVSEIKKTSDETIVSESSACTSSHQTDSTDTTDTTDIQIGGGGQSQYVPNFGDVTDCESAFRVFDDSYNGIKTEFDNVYGMLTSPDNGLSLAGAGNGQGTLKKIENDAKSAVSFQLDAPTGNEGIKLSGTISGGANDTTLLIRQTLKLEMDMNSMFGGSPQPSGPQGWPTEEPGSEDAWPTEPSMDDASLFPSNNPTMPPHPGSGQDGMTMSIDTDGTIAIDTSKKLIEQDVDMTTGFKMQGMNQAMTANGRMTLSAGDEKYVRAKLDLGTTVVSGQDTQGFVANLDMESRLVDANTVSFRANMIGSGEGAPTGEMSFELVRTADGQCQVKNQKNTMPAEHQTQGQQQDQNGPSVRS